MTQETVEELKRKIARLKQQVARSEAQMGVHPEKFDDQKKGHLCRNFIAGATFKKERDRNNQELLDLQARLEPEQAEVNPDRIPDPPSEQSAIAADLDFVI